jgi:hypothetical protein
MHRRVALTLIDSEWIINEDEVEIITPALNPQEEQFQQLLRQQEIASQWVCANTKCDQKLVDMPLEKCEWVDQGVQAALDDQGKAIETERWTVTVICNECKTPLHMEPKDFGLLGGDELFYRWNTPVGSYTVLTREQVIEMVDANIHEDVCTALGSEMPWGKVPPHLRGTYCLYAPLAEEE